MFGQKYTIGQGYISLDELLKPVSLPKYVLLSYNKTWDEYETENCGQAYATWANAADAARALAKAYPGNKYYVVQAIEQFQSSEPMVESTLSF